MRVVLDPGHGGKWPGAVNAASGLQEKAVNLAVALRVRNLLQAAGVEVWLTRESDTDFHTDEQTDTYMRADIANSKNPHAFVSIHCNSATVTTAQGTETWIRGTDPTDNDRKLGQAVQKAVTEQIQRPDRGVKEADYWVLKRCGFPACIVELAFINNTEEGALLGSISFQEKCAQGVAKGIANYLGISLAIAEEPEQPAQTGVAIQGKAELAAEQLSAFLLQNNSSPQINCSAQDLARFYIEEGEALGIRGDIAFCQSIHETGWWKFGGQVLPEQNNFAGIGATNNSAVGKGAWFSTPQEGVRAQIQHLYAYATDKPLSAGMACVDPRFGLVQRGCAPCWEDLNGRWAVPGTTYGQSILALFEKATEYAASLPAALPTEIPDVTQEQSATHWAQGSLDELTATGCISTPAAWLDFDEAPTKGQVLALVANAVRKR